MVHFEPSVESLSRHIVPEWFEDAKLGIFIHWGLFSVPGFAP
ncbi:MAG: alpha-L-fucosidase, partial [Deltaproteobacteria bacterium]|nr:alpha-L-fucosidase [Deltaproteobacteria bacterium]